MRELTVHFDENSHPIDCHFDGGEGTPISAFLFLTSVPVDPPMSHVLAFGNSDTIGRLILSFWANSVNMHPEGAWVVEQVCRDIIKNADAARREWPGDTPAQMM